MVTVIIKRSQEPTVIQLTQENIMRDLHDINHAEMLLEDSWVQGLRKVRTPYVCLVESDCVMNGGYLTSNVSLMSKDNHNAKKGTGGYLKRAMLSSCLGIKSFQNRVYNYQLSLESESDGNVTVRDWQVRPDREKRSTTIYHIQVGFVPGAIIRMSSIKPIIDTFNWDEPNLVKLSALLSFYLWDSNRRVQVNPNTTYVSNDQGLEDPPFFKCPRFDKAFNIFASQRI